MPATIKDIARLLNISTSTVSYALNGGPRRVPEDVRERVLATAAELGYRPNRIAQSMVTGKTHTFGVVQPGAMQISALSPFFQVVLDGILTGSEAVSKDVLIFTQFDTEHQQRFLDRLLDGRIDGLIFLLRRRSVGTCFRFPRWPTCRMS